MSVTIPTTLEMTAGGVATPAGFRAAGVSAGIKANGNPDLALLVSDRAATVAAVFTLNKAQAAPVLVCKDHLARSGGVARAVIVNSGCANACTGEAGIDVARGMAAETARILGCPADQVLVASTGVIGVDLSLDAIRSALPAAFSVLGADQGPQAARAIMTTDPFPKEAAVRITIGGRTVTIGGMAKGSGMIEPMMATMLGFVTTDAAVPGPLLQRALREVVDNTFNAITVDGECSTNDCVFALASGRSGVTIARDDDPRLIEPLIDVAGHLAREIVRGGEGATKLVAVQVTGAATRDDAWLAARTIANSPLVKTAIHGGDPNWGRLIAAAGRSGAAFDLAHASVAIGDVRLFDRGTPHDDRAGAAAEVLRGKELSVSVDLGAGGRYAATMWTCDFSADYVRINAEYRT
jgi:glutamate N-acetyltransferase/amino-acid N-acetyltransferase